MDRIYFPFFQVKVGGHVIGHSNNESTANEWLRSASAKPAELWRIQANGSAQLLRRSA